MSGIRDKLKKAAGLFVEFDETGQPIADPPVITPVRPQRTIEDVVNQTPGPALNEIRAEPVEQRPVFKPDGTIDFEAIYQLAGLQSVPFGAEQVLQILAELPAELPIDAKRATMKVTLGAMAKTGGGSTDSVVADASRKLAALVSYSEGFEKQASDFVAKAEAEIVRLESEVERCRSRIAEAKAQTTNITSACSRESDRLDDVLEFFSLDIAPSKLAPPTPPS